MEATALSVGKAVLDGALGYAKSFVAEEIALQLGVERDVIFIGDELEMMQSFLMTADEEQDKNKVLLTWVKQVRDTAYNVEDKLMDFALLHSEKKPFLWCIPSNLWERRRIAKGVKELRAKVEDVSSRNLRYRLIKVSGSKPTTTTAEDEADLAIVAMSGINEANRTAIKLENSVVDLRQLITSEDKDRTVIAVWGASGDLRTTSIQDVYDDSTLTANFGFRSWVKLVHPFNPREFIQSLARQYYHNFPEAIEGTHKRETIGISVFLKMESMSQDDMLDLIDTEVTDSSYLIVIENLSTKEEWDCIKNYFPDNQKGSRVIVSTPHAEIARLCTEKDHQVSELKQSSYSQSLYLFHRKVVTSSQSRVPTYNFNIVPTNTNAAMSNSDIQEEEQLYKEDGDRVSDSPSSGKKFDRSRTMALVDEVLIGRTTEESKLIKLVGQPEDEQGCKVISVWGMGGLGKTSLVQSVFRSPLLAGWKCAWATALRPFNPEQIIRKLVADLLGETKERERMELKQLTDSLTTFIKKEQCLVVLDDISSTKEWDSVNSSLKDARRIIVTTREKSIARHCSKEDKHMCNLSGLKNDTAFELFKKKVFKDGAEKIELFSDMVEQARLILQKCDGLPLAISTIGGFLATKPKTATEWRKAYNRISTELEINPELRTIKTILVKSYDGLPYHLKSCFLYLSVFPEDHKIRRKHLIRRWVAEGYAREMYGMNAEEVGDMYFEELLDRSMILPGEDVNIHSGKTDSCQLHDIMREICISKAREENLSFTLEDGCSLSSTQGAIRHLAISSDWNRSNQDVYQRIVDSSPVRSLTVSGEWRSFFISKKMRFLRVLDLHDTHELDLNQIGELIHLMYLSLRRCRRKIEHVLPDLEPYSVRNRIIRAALVAKSRTLELPPNITSLQRLQFLRADRAVVPRGIGKLKALSTLANVQLGGGKAKKGTLKELAQLYQLRKLGIAGITKANSKELWSAIHSLNHLRSLSVQSGETSSEENGLDCSLGEDLLPPMSIEIIKLDGRLVRLTEWISQLQNLSRLQLCSTLLQGDAIQAVGRLPNLAILVMRSRTFEGEDLIFEQGSFPSLVLLDLRNIGDVPFVKFEDGTMHKLEVLRILGWNNLEELSGLRYVTELKEIQLDLGYCKKFKDNVQEQLVRHPNNVKVLRK